MALRLKQVPDFPQILYLFSLIGSQYEIVHNPQTVDLLVSLAHSAAAEQVLDDPLPTGLGLRVPLPDSSDIQEPARNIYGTVPVPQNPHPPVQIAIGPDGLCDFDDLNLQMVRFSLGPLLSLIILVR